VKRSRAASRGIVDCRTLSAKSSARRGRPIARAHCSSTRAWITSLARSTRGTQ
jgi:hypothetical protein